MLLDESTNHLPAVPVGELITAAHATGAAAVVVAVVATHDRLMLCNLADCPTWS